MDIPIYNISKNQLYGRYLTASKDIKQGQLILKESPIAIGPQVGGPTVCFNCCHQLNKSFVLCPGCKVAFLCSPKCISGQMHGESECEILKSSNLKGTDLASNPEVVLPLRCLLLRQNPDKTVWNQFFDLESHLESRLNTSIWRRHEINVQDPLKSMDFLTENDLKSEIIQQICGIIDVNAFEVRPPTQTNYNGSKFPSSIDFLRGVYPLAALMAHDCVANTHGAIDDDFILWIRAAVDIEKAEAIYFNYGSPLKGCVERKQQLQEGKYFNCECLRCRDNTELGTEMSSLCCPRCHKGWIRPVFDTNEIAKVRNWICSSCGRSFSDFLIKSTICEGSRKIQELDDDIVAMEKLVKNFSTTFHPQHFLILQVEQTLARLYATSAAPKKNVIIRHIQLCSKLLQIFRKVEPGISRIQAITLFELHSALVNLAQKDYNNKEITGNQFIEKLMEAECNLKTCIKFLLYEPPKSPEGRLAQNALTALKMLRLSIANVQRSLIENPEPSNGIKAITNKRKKNRRQQ